MFLLAPKLAYSGRFWDGLGQGNCTVVVIQNMDDFPESGEISLLHFAFSQLVEFFFWKEKQVCEMLLLLCKVRPFLPKCPQLGHWIWGSG